MKKIETLIEGVGIRGARVKKGTTVEVVPAATETAALKDGQIREGVALQLIATKRAKALTGS